MNALAGKTALVTGASRGIGREIALRLARDGAFVILHYNVNRDAADAALAQVEAEGGTGIIVAADLADMQSIAPLFAAIDAGLAQHGRSGLDILVNNAGIGVQGDLMTVTPDDFDRVFAVNVRAPLFVAQQAAQRMRNGGRIINISSMVGERVYGGWYVAYGATKAALDYMTASMAVSLGPRGITVNAVAPGATLTDFVGDIMANADVVEGLKRDTALGAIGDPADIARAVALLAGPDSRWITGERIRASGGTLL